MSLHPFSVTAIPLARGNNVIRIVVVDTYGQEGTDTITVRRPDPAVGRLTIDLSPVVRRYTIDAEAATRVTVDAAAVTRYTVPCTGEEPDE